ncbi:MAG: c-type cytochrome [Candidatus Nealsonbacteria bacterium]|nr:c-type cytochrome [Candidatus Nealsonbacteria bacterium]
MTRSLLVVVSLLVLVAWRPGCIDTAHGGEIALATDAPKPLPPSESQKLFRLADGFRIELVAAEPHLADPVAMAFDARGRILVCEIHGYNLEGYLDVLQQNETGVLDKAVRRIAANPDAIRRAEQEQYGTVKLLEDTDRDGQMDRSTVLADRLPPCYGVVPARDGAIVLCAPDIVYLADRDGDGKAEIRETLFTGFGVGELWTRINNPRWNVDNWIYGTSGGGSGGTIRGPHLDGEVQLSSVCFRFKSDGSELQPAGGRTSGFGQAINDFGDRFLCTNQQHALYVAPLPYRYLARNPFFAAPNLTVNVCSYGHPARVFPASKPDPWRRARAADPAWVKFYGVMEATANGYFTAASGQAVYQAAEFPAEFRGNHFSVDNAQNLVHRCLLLPEGTSYTVRRPREDLKQEFLTSTEQWFRPVNLLTGPDGALYLVDMYRDVIEDYSAIPRYLQQLYIESLIAGGNRGRIWRIVADTTERPQKFDLTKASAEELVGRLADDNFWWRTTAQRLLVERGDRSIVESLVALVRTGHTPQSRMHALYTLEGLNALQPATVTEALDDPHFAVRMHALRLAEPWLDRHGELTEKVLAMTADEHPRVQLQLALTLGQCNDPRAMGALAQLAARCADRQWMPAAVLSSVSGSADRFLVDLLRRSAAGSEGRSAAVGKARELVEPLGAVVGARHDSEETGRVLSVLGEDRAGDAAEFVPLQTACLKGLVEGLQRGRPQPLASAAGAEGLRKLLVRGNPEVQQLALRVAGLVQLQRAPEMKAAFDAARKIALDPANDLPQRRAAVMMLTGAPLDVLAPTAGELLDPRHPLDLQLAAVEVISSADDPQVATLLLRNFKTYTPKLRAAVIDAAFGRRNRLPGLLDAMETGRVGVSGLDSFRRLQLLEDSDAQIARRAKALLSGRTGQKDRREILERYRRALSLKRDAARGRKVFSAQCAKCHKLGKEGYAVGADLSSARTRADETLVSDVMDPSNQITTGYANYTVVTEAGRIFTGLLAAETATSVTLRREEGAEQTILRKNIDQMEASSLSMMPENLEKEVSPQDLADLIAFLRKEVGPAEPPVLTLFDDERSLAEALIEGTGTATISTDGPFSGKECLAVTPPQRFSARIPGWEYRIAERPGPGEFRYLRFAWRQPAGEGVMIELAADGRWPPPDSSRLRYVSGRNTTGWQAVRISEQPPRAWVVVTRDLWKDFGPLTLTGIAPTAMGGEACFDRIELLRSLDTKSLSHTPNAGGEPVDGPCYAD